MPSRQRATSEGAVIAEVMTTVARKIRAPLTASVSDIPSTAGSRSDGRATRGSAVGSGSRCGPVRDTVRGSRARDRPGRDAIPVWSGEGHREGVEETKRVNP
jgi:hypothetical protein